MGIVNRASNYSELRYLIDARRIDLQLCMLEVDFDANLPDGYFAKLISGMRNFGPSSLDPILNALKIDICLVARQDEANVNG